MKSYVKISTCLVILFASVTVSSQEAATSDTDSTKNEATATAATDVAGSKRESTDGGLDASAIAEVRAAEQRRVEAIDKAVQAALAIFSPGGGGGGSGVVITPDGYALTNFHVVKPAGTYMFCGMSDGRRYDAVLVGIDPTGDVALIKLLGRDDFPVAEIADSDEVRVGDWCFAVGNPFLLATDFKPTVTFGIVSGVHRYQYPAGTLLEYADCIQTDAAINPGNSGGPLFDSLGRLIGINGRGSFEKRGRVNVGVGYAISINQIQHFMGYLRSGRIVDHATLGATVRTSDEGRVVVQNILRGCDAFRRGLRYGDEIVSFGNRDVTTVNGFKNVLGIYPRGWRVPLSYRRNGERFDVLVRLKGVHSPAELIEAVQGPRPQPPGPDKPKPGDKPKPSDPKNPQPPVPPRPGQRPGRPKVVVPAEAKKLIESKRGYANYYFNRILREKVLADFKTVAGSDYPDSTWEIKGKFNGRADFEIELRSDFVTGRYPEGPDRIDLSKDLDTQLAPIGSHGMLAGLHAWQRFLISGRQEFGDAYYLGTIPLAGYDKPCHVLVGTYNVLEVRLVFGPDNGHLVAMEVFSSAEIDPCELYFADFRDMGNGRIMPSQIEVRVGLDTFATLTVNEYSFSDTTAPKEAAPNPKVEADATDPNATNTEPST
jgi:S1-C subfamily serine protease